MSDPQSSPAGQGGHDEALGALLRDLRAELGEFGYQWLAACAVYPRLHWHLTVYLGAELAKARHLPLPNEGAFLALARLSWFRKGRMPDAMRLRLLADLIPDNRETVREAIKRLFHGAMGAAADSADGTFEIAFAGEAPPPGWREALRRMLATADPDSPVHDAIFVRYMLRRPPGPLDLRLDRALVGLFGARFAGWFDLNTLAAVLTAAAMAVACWFAGQWVTDRYLSERTTAIPAASLLPLDLFRDCFGTVPANGGGHLEERIFDGVSGVVGS